MAAFLLSHEGSSDALANIHVSVDKLESLVGIDFFQSLSDAAENAM